MTGGLSHFALREPLWLLLALVPVVLLIWRTANYQLPARLKEFAEPHLWRWLLTPHDKNKAAIPWLLIVAWLLASLALSGPYLQRPQPATQPQRGMDIAVVIDISPSMKASDVFPSRLERIKLEMQDFTASLKGDRVALIAFSANAYNILPLTHDRSTLLHFVKALDVTLTRKRGSNIVQALELARQTLAQSKQGSRAIVLISDGETDDTASTQGVAQRLSKDGIPLYIMGVGTEAGSPISDDSGRLMHYNDAVVISRLQRAALISLAAISGGAYTDLQDDDSDWRHLFSAMDRLARDNVYQTPVAQTGYPLYPWLLGVSILLFFWSGTRRADIMAAVLLTPFFCSHNVQASPWEEQQAYDAFNNKEYDKATIAYEQIRTFNGQMGMGAAAYRLGDWQQALEAFTRATQLATNDNEQAKAAYNRGNTLARMGDYDKASEAYQNALSLLTNYPHAALNLTLVNKERRQAGIKQIDRPKITPDAEQALHNKNAVQTDEMITNGQRDQSKAANREANTRLDEADRKKLVEQTIAQWNLGSAGTSESLGSALWQQRGLGDTPNALLRARFTDLDAQHPALPEEKPW